MEHSNPDGVVNDIRRAVDRVTNLPTQVKDRPIVTEQKSSNFPVLEIAIHGAMDEMELQEMGRFIEDEMRKVSGVSRVDAFGKRKEEWRIRVDPDLKKGTPLVLQTSSMPSPNGISVFLQDLF